jgi:ribosomal protein L40E
MADTTIPPPTSGPTMTCPKCGAVQALAVACRKCGLQSTRMRSYRETESAVQDPAVTAAWAACMEAWDDPGRHEKFTAAVVEASAFAFAARQYRGVAASRPDDLIATAQIERLRKMAEAALRVTATRRPEAAEQPYKKATLVLIACLVAIAFGLLYAFITRKDAASGELTPVERRPAPTHR